MYKIKSAFGTPILVKDWPDSEEVDNHLTDIILNRESSLSNAKDSCIGSWNSPKDLLQWPYKEIAIIKQRIVSVTREMTMKVTQGKYSPASQDMYANAWANVSRADSYLKIHNHESCTWSGVYYVHSVLSQEKSKSSGIIEFLDPRMLCIATELPNSNFGGRVRVMPKSGRMILFPNWLLHYVNPVEDKSLRICIAFNVKLETNALKRRSASMLSLGDVKFSEGHIVDQD